MNAVLGQYRSGAVYLDRPLDLPEGQPIYITLSREKPVDLMSADEIHEIIMSFDSVDPLNEWGTRDPKSWDKLWRRTPAEAAAEILRRRARLSRVAADPEMVS